MRRDVACPQARLSHVEPIEPYFNVTLTTLVVAPR